eukprot:14455096-Alexandrium_andersonii.AAC.1
MFREPIARASVPSCKRFRVPCLLHGVRALSRQGLCFRVVARFGSGAGLRRSSCLLYTSPSPRD